ncbi:MAG TPA: DUF368 domain-containing protein [Candidatus Atribacteria bacterium]|nr:DUF368 domain-containing protein [Candidatus Atribacteria bacterium]
MKDFLYNFLIGFIIGASGIAPGVSGGAFAVMFGIYERLTYAIANIFKEFKKQALYFLPIALGAAFGFLSLTRLMGHLFQNYQVQVKYLFIGLMLGTLPSVRKQANKHGFRPVYLIAFFTTLTLAVLLYILNETAGPGAVVEPDFFLLAISGAILGIGTLTPGISAAFIMMYLGTYQPIIDAVPVFDIPVLLPVGIGFAVSVAAFAKLVTLLFKKAYGYTYYGILGFVLGSIVLIFPGFMLKIEYILGILLLAAGCAASYLLSRFEKAD